MENIITFIGDVHCKYNKYYAITTSSKKTIQMGDFGFKTQHQYMLKEINTDNHKVLFGNHEDYNFVNEKHSLGHYGLCEDNKIGFVRGAYSIDQYRRIEGIDYFKEEELSYFELCNAVDLIVDKKPPIIISHDCPAFLAEQQFNIHDKSITRTCLNFIFNDYKPKLWIFGHHHRSLDITIDGTRFICLKELETIDINLNDY